jgi:predicted anti-sigma-YlaC factor YlaD
MKCEKIESLIYLYNELDKQQRHQVDMHLSGCSSCKALFGQVNDQYSMIRNIGEMPIVAESPERIKRGIMQAIESSKKNLLDEIISIVTAYWLRVSLSVASILLAGFFFVELSVVYSRTTVNSTYSVSSTYLNTPKFLKAHVKRRESSNQVSFYDCLKQGDCDYLKNLKTDKN